MKLPRIVDALLSRLVGRLLRLSPVDPRRCRHVHHLDASGALVCWNCGDEADWSN